MPVLWAGGNQGLLNLQVDGILIWFDLFVTDGETEAQRAQRMNSKLLVNRHCQILISPVSSDHCPEPSAIAEQRNQLLTLGTQSQVPGFLHGSPPHPPSSTALIGFLFQFLLGNSRACALQGNNFLLSGSQVSQSLGVPTSQVLGTEAVAYPSPLLKGSIGHSAKTLPGPPSAPSTCLEARGERHHGMGWL